MAYNSSMKWILLSESYISNGIEIIKKSFNDDYTYEKIHSNN